MGNLLFLLIAIVLSAVGILIVWARHRGPSGVNHGVDSFSEQMRAIAPDRPDGPGVPRSGGPDGPKPGR